METLSKTDDIAAQSNAALLTYAINTQPSPIEIGKPVSLDISVNNSSATGIVAYLKEIAIQLPVGDDATSRALTTDSASLRCAVTPNDVWTIANANGIVTIKSISGKAEAISTNSLSIQLSQVLVNAQVGTCIISIVEITSDADGTNSVTNQAPPLSIVKTLNNFYLSDLSANSVGIPPDGTITLSWQVGCIAGCTLSLIWDEHNISVTNDNSYPVSATDMSDSTTFALKALVPTDSGNVSFQRQVTVVVKRPSIDNFVAQHDKIYVGDRETLTWRAQYVSHCALFTSTGLLIVDKDKLLPDEHGIYTCSINPQHTTTYYVQPYDAQGNPSPQSVNLTVPVHKMTPETPITIFSSQSGLIVNSIQLSTDKQTLFISYMGLMPAHNPTASTVINYISAYDVNTKIVTSIEIDPQLRITGFIRENEVGYAFSFAQILILDLSSNTVTHTVTCPQPPGVSKSCLDQLSRSDYNQACLVNHILYVWSESSKYCWQLDTQTLAISVSERNISQAPEGAVWAVVNPMAVFKFKEPHYPLAQMITAYNTSIYANTSTVTSIKLNPFLSVTGFLKQNSVMYAFSGAQVFIGNLSPIPSIHKIITCLPPSTQYQPYDIQTACLWNDSIYYWSGSQEFCWEINTTTNSVTTTAFTPTQIPEGEGQWISFNQKKISTTNELYQISSDGKTVTASVLQDVLVPAGATTQVSNIAMTLFGGESEPLLSDTMRIEKEESCCVIH